jgi:hypothetical protein
MATALLGPLALGWIDYHVSSGAADQLRGGDVAGLVLVGPVALAAACRVATDPEEPAALPWDVDTAHHERRVDVRCAPRSLPQSQAMNPSTVKASGVQVPR